eukprot:3079172-Pyramimonas_sp.AAC.1
MATSRSSSKTYHFAMHGLWFQNSFPANLAGVTAPTSQVGPKAPGLRVGFNLESPTLQTTSDMLCIFNGLACVQQSCYRVPPRGRPEGARALRQIIYPNARTHAWVCSGAAG